MNNDLAVRPALVLGLQLEFLYEFPKIVNLAVADETTSFQEKGLVAFRGLSVDGETVKSPETMVSVRVLGIIDENAIVGAAMCDFTETRFVDSEFVQ
jgi:hypothetical protein